MRRAAEYRTPIAFITALLALAWTMPLKAAELPYRQMALKSLHCKTIHNKRRHKNCAQNATAPIHATCQRFRGMKRKACFRRHTLKLRFAIAEDLKRRKRK